MPATDTPQSPTPDGTAPPGWTFALYFRRHRGEKWKEVLRSTSAEELWVKSLEYRTNGHFREVLVPADLTDAAEPTR